MVTTTPAGASIRFMDTENRGVFTVGRVRPDFNNTVAVQCVTALNAIMEPDLGGVRLTVTVELMGE